MDHTDDFLNNAINVDIPVSHISTEALIQYEQIYRDAIVAIERAKYPAIRYDDHDLLTEGIAVSKKVSIYCIKQYNNTGMGSYKKAMSQVTKKLSAYNSLVAKSKFVRVQLKGYASEVPVYTYKYGIPNIDSIDDQIRNSRARLGYFYSNECTNNDISKIIKKDTDVCVKASLGCDHVPGNVNEWFYDELRNSGRTQVRRLDKNYITEISDKSKYFAECMKDIEHTMSHYKRAIIRYEDVINSIAITNDMSYTEQQWIEYNIVMMHNIFTTITPLIMCKIEALGDELSYYSDILNQYIHSKNGVIVVTEGADFYGN